MKKLLIATAAMAVVAGAQAQSSVTVYGIVDGNYSTSKQTFVDVGGNHESTGILAATRQNVNNSGVGAVDDPTASSRLGFRGTEDLGGGLSANFNLEFDLTLMGGTALTATDARTSTVGVSDNKIGTVNIGRQLTGVHTAVAGYNPLAGNNMVGDILYSAAFRAHSVSNLNANFVASGVGATTGSIVAPGVDSVRMNRGVSYVSPTFNGFNVRVDYANDQVNADTATAAAATQVKHNGYSVNYATGPVRLVAATHRAKADISTTSTALSETKVNAISAAYDLNSAISLQASHATSEYITSSAQTSKTKATRLGANYNVGKWVLAAQYGVGDVTTTPADATSTAALGAGTQADRKAYQLAGFYNLSKRTALYAAYGYQEQKITAQVLNNAGDANTTSIGDKIKYTQTAVGIRHSF